MGAKELTEICSKYNTQRDLFKSLDLKKYEIIEVLKECGFKYIEIVFCLLVKNNSVIKSGDKAHTIFRFSPSPIHISLLDKIMKEAKEVQYSYTKKYNENKIERPIIKQTLVIDKKAESILPEKPNKHIDEEYCINFLKERGYKILKPVTEYTEL